MPRRKYGRLDRIRRGVSDTFSPDDYRYFGALCLFRLLRDPYLYERYIVHPSWYSNAETGEDSWDEDDMPSEDFDREPTEQDLMEIEEEERRRGEEEEDVGD